MRAKYCKGLNTYTKDCYNCQCPEYWMQGIGSYNGQTTGSVDNIVVFGPDLVQNGDFEELGDNLVDDDYSNWVISPQWNVSGVDNNLLLHLPTPGSSSIELSGVLTENFVTANAYKLTYEFTLNSKSSVYSISDKTTGASTVIPSTVGEHTVYFLNDGTTPVDFVIEATDDPSFGTAGITNISIQQADPNAEWFKFNSYITNGQATLDGRASFSVSELAQLTQTILNVGETYRASYDVVSKKGEGLASLSNNLNETIQEITGVGSYEVEFTHTGTNGTVVFRIAKDAMTIDNVVILRGKTKIGTEGSPTVIEESPGTVSNNNSPRTI